MFNKMKSLLRNNNLLIILYILICVPAVIKCFNLENRLPIIKYNDNDNSYFGYSVAIHHENASQTTWLLVGAPLAQNLQPKTNRSGGLFKCPITQNTDDCVQVITDGRRNKDGGYENTEGSDILSEPLFDREIKDGEWMGVTVSAQRPAGMVLVCAHRYVIKNGESQLGQGLCYVLNNDLEYDEIYEPCKGRTTARMHEDYAFCQAGTSGTLLNDGTMILGAPGLYTWRGTIFTIEVSGDYLKRDKTPYYGPHEDKISPVDKYSYLGMSVTGGKYFGSQQAFVGGAPRAENHGQVVFFEKNKPGTPSNPMAMTMKIDGEQFASGFGYELCTADINGDGLPDLLVSAPFYFGRHEGGAVYVYQNADYTIPKVPSLKLVGKVESRFGLALSNIGDINKDNCDDIAIGAPYEDDGVVYIYLGSKSGLSNLPSQIIRASDLGNANPNRRITTFGSSINGGVDIDGNTYPDILIGAYNSSTVIALLARPITNIQTEVRSEEIKNIDPSKNGCLKNPSSNLTCFSFQACCSIELSTATSRKLDMIYTIEAETFNNNKKFSRVYFDYDITKRSNIVKRNIMVESNGNWTCHEETVYIKENARDIQSPIKFRLNYTLIEPELPTSGLIAGALHPILDQREADRQITATFQKDCGTDDICQSQLEVDAHIELEKEKGQYLFVLGKTDEIQLNVTVVNLNDSAYEAQLFIIHQSSVTYRGVGGAKGAVICNRFNKTVVACTLGNPLKRNAEAKATVRFDPSGLEDSEPTMTFTIFANSTSKQLRPLDDIILVTNVVKRAEISLTGYPRPEQAFYGGDIKGESAMESFDDVGTSVEHTFQVFNDGPWRAPYVELEILWPHQVANDKAQGKWLLYLEELPIVNGAAGGECSVTSASHVNPLKLIKKRVPNELVQPATYSEPLIKQNHNRSHTFSMEYREKMSPSYSSDSKSSESTKLNRVRRDRAMKVKPESLVDKDGKKTNIVYMDCKRNTAKCIKINCKIFNMQRKTEAFITVKSRLWNSTLTMDYPRVDLVKIYSSATVRIPDMYGIQQNKQDDVTSIETHAYPELMDQNVEKTIPAWIIIIGIIVGLLLLALVAFILWKCGFFKRRRPDPTLSGNLEKNSDESKTLIAK